MPLDNSAHQAPKENKLTNDESSSDYKQRCEISEMSVSASNKSVRHCACVNRGSPVDRFIHQMPADQWQIDRSNMGAIGQCRVKTVSAGQRDTKPNFLKSLKSTFSCRSTSPPFCTVTRERPSLPATRRESTNSGIRDWPNQLVI